MKKLICLALFMFFATVMAFGQVARPLVPPCDGTNGPQCAVQTCNSFDSFDATTGLPNGNPIYAAAGWPSTAGTRLCTDYFGAANYANSPLPVGTVSPNFTILNGGTGYTAPVVSIVDFYNTPGAGGASAVASIDSYGAITAVTLISGGQGYVAPVVNITDPSPNATDAMVFAQLDPSNLAPNTGLRKFRDALPNLGTGLPLAAADTTIFPGSDYYEIALVEYSQQLHSDLPPTKLRGYVQVPAGSAGCAATQGLQPSYLGPVIVASKNTPVRVKFINCLPGGAGGNLFIPVDTTYMGAGLGPDGQPYLQNRATLHLHGGNTPWISDGTPHQWTVPVDDWNNTTHQRGDSTAFVPDMWFDAATGAVITDPTCAGKPSCALPGATNDPGPGAMSFYWTNQQGGRLMFYHDHAYGLTRLNVYAGEAAGYLLVDPAEEDALAGATVPGTVGTVPDLAHLVPLVIQDKTFVPTANQIAAEDPTWMWGSSPSTAVNGTGDLWFPHVYLPNQNPGDAAGSNAFGRWDYGAWFFPPMTTLDAAGPRRDGLANGAVTIPCTSTSFPTQLLQPAAANNYQQGCPIIPNPSGTPEAFMDTPLVNGKAYPVLHVAPEAYRFRILSAGNDRTLNLSLFQACGSGSAADANPNCAPTAAFGTEVPMTPAVRGGPGTSGYLYPDQLDGRDGGVPDSRAAGPAFVQIGTEGGLLPAPAVITAGPVGFEYGRRSITVLNVSKHQLMLGPAERADVIVDFRNYAGKTLILYNDAPAPIPAFDARIDYYTGDLDEVQQGGAPTTLPGFGPNTRTLMQIVVDAPAAGSQTAFSLSTLQSQLPLIFKAATGMQPAIVPEPTYPLASGGNASTATYSSISDNNITFTPVAGTTPAMLNLEPTKQDCGSTATSACVVMNQKAIQELFTLDYGRMNATLGTELPLTNFQTQTTIPYGYVDWPTEIVKDGQTQVWKLTHNGVDTHFIHFHLFNVQVINRIGWDGVIKPPDQNELGWKDTVRMNPLEDIVFALQPLKQNLPFPLKDSIRLNDVTMGAMPDPNISGLDPLSGNATISNANRVVNFGWEYVWHCHILGHEENDMMRPIIFQVPPPAPSTLSAAPDTGGVNLSWIDTSSSETSFVVQRDTNAAFTSTPATLFTVDGATGSGFDTLKYGQPITFTDNSANPTLAYYYRVQAIDNFSDGSPAPLAPPFQTVPLASAWSNVAATAGVTPTTTSIVTTPITYGQDALVTVIVSPAVAPPVAAGTVTLTVDGVALPAQTLGAAGSATFNIVAPAAGTHVLTASFGVQFGFGASTFTASLLVNPAPVTVTASSATMTYGGAVPAITPAFSGFVLGQSSAVLTTQPTCTTAATATSPVGSATSSCSGAVAANYTFTYVDGSVTVTGAPLTVTASSAAIVYGASLPTISPIYAGFVNGDTAGTAVGTAPVCSTTAAAGSPIDTYATNCSGAVAANYIVSYVQGTLTISTAALTITASSGTMPYGGTVPAITAAYAGFVNGDTSSVLTTQPTCSTTATATSNVGTYPSNCSGAVAANYAISYVAGSVSVTPAPLSIAVTPAAVAMTYGGPVPALTPTYTGFVLSQGPGNLTGTVTCSTTATSASPVSLTSYPSSCAGATSTNYTITYVPGSVTVNKATSGTVITAAPNPAIRGQIVTASIKVSPQFTGIPTGTVTVLAATGETCSAALNATGAGSCNLTFQVGGARLLTATYPGDGNFINSSGTVTENVSSVSLSTTALLFGNQTINTTSARQTITLTNVGAVALTMNTITIAGANAGDFIQTNNCPLGTTLPAGRACSINVTFRPTILGVETATLSISDVDPTSPQTVSLTGTGAQPGASLSPSAYGFGTVKRGSSASTTFTLTNNGATTLAINTISTNSNQFSAKSNCGNSLAVGASCTITVQFAPTQKGALSATLSVVDNAANSPQTATLTGTGQ